MARKYYWLTVITVVLGCASTAFAEAESAAGELRNLVIQNLNALQSEDLEAALSVIHTQGPAYLSAKVNTPHLFENIDLKYDLMDYKYIGQDEDYAVARTKVRDTKVAGPAFQNRELDLISVFRRENGQWKFWSQITLDTKYLNE